MKNKKDSCWGSEPYVLPIWNVAFQTQKTEDGRVFTTSDGKYSFNFPSDTVFARVRIVQFNKTK